MRSNRDQKLLKQISEEITDIECFMNKVKMSQVWQMVQEDLPNLRAGVEKILRNL